MRIGADRRRRVELRQLDPAVAVRGLHHCDVDSDVVEPDDAVHPLTLDGRLVLQFHAKFDKERNCSLEVIHHDADVVHPLNRHFLEHRDRGFVDPALGTASA